jgi:hypothetical protein
MRTSELIERLQRVMAEHGDVPVTIYSQRPAPATNSNPNLIVTLGSSSSYYYILPDYVYGEGKGSEPTLFIGDLHDSDLEWNRRIAEKRAKEN